MNKTQQQIADLQEQYDDAVDKLASSAKADKQFELELAEEMQTKRKARGATREDLVKQKGEIHRKLVDAKNQRVGEIVAAVDSGEMPPETAKVELVSLGHTPASADIEIARALKQQPSNFAPVAESKIAQAPLPAAGQQVANQPAPAPTKVDDPISAAKPVSQQVIYRDGQPKPGEAAHAQPKPAAPAARPAPIKK
jgi:hypothetical protein